MCALDFYICPVDFGMCWFMCANIQFGIIITMMENKAAITKMSTNNVYSIPAALAMAITMMVAAAATTTTMVATTITKLTEKKTRRKKNHIELFYRCALAEYMLMQSHREKEQDREVNELQIALVRSSFSFEFLNTLHIRMHELCMCRIVFFCILIYIIFFCSSSLSLLPIFFLLLLFFRIAFLYFYSGWTHSVPRTLISVIIRLGIFILHVQPFFFYVPRSTFLSLG